MKRFCILLVLLLPLLAYAGEAGQTLIKTDLKQEPFADAKTIATLDASTAVEVIKRQGGWMQVKPATGAEGWVKMTTIKIGGPGAAAKGDTGMTSLWNVASQGRSGNTGVTVATGVRGLSPEDMKNAKPAPDEVKKLDNYAASKSQAESSASKAKLASQKVDYLAEAKAAGGKK
jgi:hypothetical protein